MKKNKHKNCISKIEWLKTLPRNLLIDIDPKLLPCKDCEIKNNLKIRIKTKERL